jgi:hypothetical protein
MGPQDLVDLLGECHQRIRRFVALARQAASRRDAPPGADMPKRATGRYERTTEGGQEVAAFVPHALPPADPPIVVDGRQTMDIPYRAASSEEPNLRRPPPGW